MRSGKGSGDIIKTGKWPCAICGKGIISNSINELSAVNGFTGDVVTPRFL